MHNQFETFCGRLLGGHTMQSVMDKVTSGNAQRGMGYTQHARALAKKNVQLDEEVARACLYAQIARGTLWSNAGVHK